MELTHLKNNISHEQRRLIEFKHILMMVGWSQDAAKDSIEGLALFKRNKALKGRLTNPLRRINSDIKVYLSACEEIERFVTDFESEDSKGAMIYMCERLALFDDLIWASSIIPDDKFKEVSKEIVGIIEKSLDEVYTEQ